MFLTISYLLFLWSFLFVFFLQYKDTQMDDLAFYFSNKIILLSFALIPVFTEHVTLFPSLIFLCYIFISFSNLGSGAEHDNS